jgi:hypothetical protein
VKRLIFPQILVLLSACEAPPESRITAPFWSNEAEVLFQEAEALKYTLEQQKLETRRLREQGLKGAPPSPRR